MKILVAGESWVKHIIHIKGFDSFTNSEYEEGIYWFQRAMEEAGFDMTFMPNHEAQQHFPTTLEALNQYDVVILSDIGSNTLLLSNKTFGQSQTAPNRLELLKEYVHQGGGFGMIGGYLSFTGIDAKGKYKDTAIEEILPVELLNYDDRHEAPEGIQVSVKNSNHPILKNVTGDWPHFLGYNKLIPKSSAGVLLSHKDYAFLAVQTVGKGRTMSFASDVAPHWGPPAFMEWEHYNLFWKNTVEWLAGGE